jgi:outer membrane immunogenic protein
MAPMRMMLFATAAMIAMTGASRAADVVVLEPAPVMAPSIDWSGFYAGVHGGYGWADTDAEFTNGIPGAVDLDLDGFFGGGQVGYNFVFGSGLLLGVEADFSFADINGSDTVDIGPGDTTVSMDINSMASVRGRVGFAMDRFLPYVTAGWAWADVDRSNSWTGETLGENYDGWTVGAGFQYAINTNWSAGLEYRYTDFGSQTFEASNGFDTEADLELHTVRFTLNYRF